LEKLSELLTELVSELKLVLLLALLLVLLLNSNEEPLLLVSRTKLLLLDPLTAAV